MVQPDKERQLDDVILNIFEQTSCADRHFYFPVTSQNEARAFVLELHTRGVQYSRICATVGELEQNFTAWRTGLNRPGIGNRVVERINRPLQELLLAADDLDADVDVKFSDVEDDLDVLTQFSSSLPVDGVNRSKKTAAGTSPCRTAIDDQMAERTSTTKTTVHDIITDTVDHGSGSFNGTLVDLAADVNGQLSVKPAVTENGDSNNNNNPPFTSTTGTSTEPTQDAGDSGRGTTCRSENQPTVGEVDRQEETAATNQMETGSRMEQTAKTGNQTEQIEKTETGSRTEYTENTGSRTDQTENTETGSRSEHTDKTEVSGGDDSEATTGSQTEQIEKTETGSRTEQTENTEESGGDDSEMISGNQIQRRDSWVTELLVNLITDAEAISENQQRQVTVTSASSSSSSSSAVAAAMQQQSPLVDTTILTVSTTTTTSTAEDSTSDTSTTVDIDEPEVNGLVTSPPVVPNNDTVSTSTTYWSFTSTADDSASNSSGILNHGTVFVDEPEVNGLVTSQPEALNNDSVSTSTTYWSFTSTADDSASNTSGISNLETVFVDEPEVNGLVTSQPEVANNNTAITSTTDWAINDRTAEFLHLAVSDPYPPEFNGHVTSSSQPEIQTVAATAVDNSAEPEVDSVPDQQEMTLQTTTISCVDVTSSTAEGETTPIPEATQQMTSSSYAKPEVDSVPDQQEITSQTTATINSVDVTSSTPEVETTAIPEAMTSEMTSSLTSGAEQICILRKASRKTDDFDLDHVDENYNSDDDDEVDHNKGEVTGGLERRGRQGKLRRRRRCQLDGPGYVYVLTDTTEDCSALCRVKVSVV